MNSDFIKGVAESKSAYRAQLAKKPIAEKLWLMERMAERALATRKDTSAPPPDSPWEIPKHWRWAKLGDVATVVGGGTPRTDRPEFFGGDVPWITPADLSKYTAKTIARGARNISEAGLANSGAQLLPTGTVLFSSRAPIGYVAIAAGPVATNQGFKSFVLREELFPDFVYYYLQRAKELAVALASGTTFLEISGKKAAQIPIPVPPLSEQRRIVAEIEKQFTRLDAGVAALRRVQANLKRYRAAVLKSACEGRLVPTEVELARKEGRPFETGELLLQRILTDRRKNWTGRGKYKEPSAPEGLSGVDLPDGWTWTGFDQLADGARHAIKAGPFGSALKKSFYTPSGFKIYGQEQVIKGDAYFGDYFISRERFEALESCAVKPGDILISLVGTTGKVLILPNDCAPGIINPRLLKLSLIRERVSTRFIKILLESPQTRAFFKLAAHGGTMEILNLGILKSLPVALPPFAEQERIVAEVERRLSVIDELETVVTANLARATRLRQSILQKAFSGSPT